MLLPPGAACRRALIVAAAAVIASPRSRAGADGGSTAGLRLDGAALQRAQQQLYAPLPEVQRQGSQVRDAIRIKTMRGVWQLREYPKDGGAGKFTEGNVTFQGSTLEARGRAVYAGEAAAGRGPWIIKSDGFGPNPEGAGGIIEQKALWKLRRGEAGTFTYAGRVAVPSFTGSRPNAFISGDVIQLIDGGRPKGGSERAVGRFEAKLLRLLTAEDEGEGGTFAAVEIVPVLDEQLVYRQPRPSAAAADPLDFNR